MPLLTIPNVANATNQFSPAALVVDPIPGNGTHTTITNAVSQAVSGQTIFIRPGTYTENFTLPAGINLTAFVCDPYTPNVIINGTITCSDSGSRTISGIMLQTNLTYFLVVTLSASTVVNLIGCYLNCAGTTGFTFIGSNPNAQINIFNCQGNLTDSFSTLFLVNSTGLVNIRYSYFTNTGNSILSSGTGSGRVLIEWSYIEFPIAATNSGWITSRFTDHNCQNINRTALFFNGNGGPVGSSIETGLVRSGTASNLSIGIGVTATVYLTDFDSSNANVITGNGTLYHSGLNFNNSSANINVTTQIVRPYLCLLPRTVVASSPYTVLSTDYYMSVDTTSARTIKLPNVPSTNQEFIIKDYTGNALVNNITITTAGGSVTIDGATSFIINDNYGSIRVLFNGVSYEVN